MNSKTKNGSFLDPTGGQFGETSINEKTFPAKIMFNFSKP